MTLSEIKCIFTSIDSENKQTKVKQTIQIDEVNV